MVFSSIPTYQIDASNWQQQQNHQIIIGSSSTDTSLPPPPPQSFPSPVLSQPHGGVGSGSIRPGSMSERARIANIPVPDMALKCPRCESINTKFCYYNNYNLSQPRHFCKTCRRYWTRGGALRSVPVGGGCRRNKRSKSTTSKTPTTIDTQITSNSATSGSANILGLAQPQFPPLRFMSPLSQLTNHNFTSDINYNGISAPMVGTNDMNFNLLGHGSGGVASFLSGGGSSSINEPWRLQQFPFLDGSYQFQGSESEFEGHHHQVLRPPKFSSSMMTTQMVTEKKMEEKTELNLSRQFLGLQGNDDQWNHNLTSNNANAAWTELCFGSSSMNNL